jgi:hypothetical protein
MSRSLLNHPTVTNPARLAVALTAAGALAGGAYVAQAHHGPPHLRILGLPTAPQPHRTNVTPTSLVAITGTTSTSVTGYSRTSSATPST